MTFVSDEYKWWKREDKKELKRKVWDKPIWPSVCRNYKGNFSLRTRRQMFVKEIDDTYPCDDCARNPCLWQSLGDKLIDIVGFEWKFSQDDQEVTPEMFRNKLSMTLISLIDGTFVPRCCRDRYNALFPNPQVEMLINVDDNMPDSDEYHPDFGPFWVNEDALFERL